MKCQNSKYSFIHNKQVYLILSSKYELEKYGDKNIVQK